MKKRRKVAFVLAAIWAISLVLSQCPASWWREALMISIIFLVAAWVIGLEFN